MSTKTPPDNLATFIAQLDAATLSSVLIELAEDHGFSQKTGIVEALHQVH
jgi:hypothetical protein